MNKRSITFFIVSVVLIFGLTGCVNKKQTEVPINTDVSITDNVAKPNCELACTNYVKKCLYLVPGATQQLFKEGQDSCLEECNSWDAEKIQCMQDAENCTLMTDECKL